MTVDPGLSSIVVAVISALLGGFVSYILARREAEIKLLSMIDEATANERLNAYKRLWKLMELLPEYPMRECVTYGEVRKLNEDFRDWYFNKGGIYLTKQSKDQYIDAQKQMSIVWKAHETNLADTISSDDYKNTREKLSDLRDRLAEDLRSRLPPGAPGRVENIS